MHPLAIRQDFGNNGLWTRWLEACGLRLVWKKRSILLATVALVVAPLFGQSSQEFEARRDLKYATHEGVELVGDYYVPKRPGKFPIVVAMHGGGWQLGDRTPTDLFRQESGICQEA
jgi:acetyl esterase/lipase